MWKGRNTPVNRQAYSSEPTSKPSQEPEYYAVFDPLKAIFEARLAATEMLDERL